MGEQVVVVAALIILFEEQLVSAPISSAKFKADLKL